jgi:hypothetical protein
MTKVSQPVGCVAVKQKVQHHTRCRRRNFEKGTVHGQRTKQCCPLPNFAVVTQLRHSSVVSPEPCLKHSVISTAMLGLHEILCPSTAADGQTASVSNNTAFPLAGDASHAPPAKKHLTEPSPKISTAVCCMSPIVHKKRHPQQQAVIAVASAETLTALGASVLRGRQLRHCPHEQHPSVLRTSAFLHPAA